MASGLMIKNNWRNRLLAIVTLASTAGFLGGCTGDPYHDSDDTAHTIGNYFNLRNGFLDPSQVGRFDKAKPFGQSKPVSWPILDQLDVGDDMNENWLSATDPLPSDVVSTVEEYKVGEGDLIRVSVFELVTPGLEYFKETQVNELGDITLQNLQQVNVAGLTPTEIEHKISQMAIERGFLLPPGNGSPGPQVSVTLLQSRARVFSILGSAGAPGTYNIIGTDFRLLDALSLAHDVAGGTQPGMDYLYVIRPPKGAGVVPATPRPGTGPTTGPATTNPLGALDSIEHGPATAPSTAPATRPGGPGAEGIPYRPMTLADVVASGADRLVAQADLDAALGGARPATGAASMPAAAPAAAATAPSTMPGDDLLGQAINGTTTRPGYAFVDGKWVQIAGGGPNGMSQDENIAAATGLTNPRVIRIPINQLKQGNPRYNIVIRPGDIINIPNIEPGEFYMLGHVGRTGVYTITGRKVTLKQAVAAAGGLDAVAIPRRCDLIRRIGPNQEVTVQVDLQRIFDGEQPDIFLKPNDLINVGTDMIAPFLAVTRNAYRASYGWGFVYDRNLYNPGNNTNQTNSLAQ